MNTFNDFCIRVTECDIENLKQLALDFNNASDCFKEEQKMFFIEYFNDHANKLLNELSKKIPQFPDSSINKLPYIDLYKSYIKEYEAKLVIETDRKYYEINHDDNYKPTVLNNEWEGVKVSKKESEKAIESLIEINNRISSNFNPIELQLKLKQKKNNWFNRMLLKFKII